MNHRRTVDFYLTNHYFVMFLSGLLSTMNIRVDKYDDIKFSINDAYMILLMTGLMFLFYNENKIIIIGSVLVITNILCIRNQFLVTDELAKLKIFYFAPTIQRKSEIFFELNNIN